MMTTTLASTDRQPNNKGEKAKGGWVLSNFFFLGFVLWWVLFFLLCFYQTPKKKFFLSPRIWLLLTN